jgi:hypothetical protein
VVRAGAVTQHLLTLGAGGSLELGGIPGAVHVRLSQQHAHQEHLVLTAGAGRLVVCNTQR